MNTLGKWLIGFGLCLMSNAYADGGCASGRCGQSMQSANCAPGECYLFHESVSCSANDYSCKDGERRIWSYRPMYYAVDNSELLKNLHKKLCPKDSKKCIWPYSMRDGY